MAEKPKLLLLLDVDGTLIYAEKTVIINEQGVEAIDYQLNYVFGDKVWHDTLLKLKSNADDAGVELVVGLVSNKPDIDVAIEKLLIEFDPTFFCAWDAGNKAYVPRNSSENYANLVDAETGEIKLHQVMFEEDCGEPCYAELDISSVPLSPTIILRDVSHPTQAAKSSDILGLCERLGISSQNTIFVDDTDDIVDDANRSSIGMVIHAARKNPRDKSSLPYLRCYQDGEFVQEFSEDDGLEPLAKLVSQMIGTLVLPEIVSPKGTLTKCPATIWQLPDLEITGFSEPQQSGLRNQ